MKIAKCKSGLGTCVILYGFYYVISRKFRAAESACYAAVIFPSCKYKDDKFAQHMTLLLSSPKFAAVGHRVPWN